MTAQETLVSDGRRTLKDAASIQLVLSLLIPSVGALGILMGIMWTEIRDNSSNIAKFPDKIDEAVSNNSEFHTAQRVRVWNQMNVNEQAQAKSDKDLARLEGRLEGIADALERVLDKLDRIVEKE